MRMLTIAVLATGLFASSPALADKRDFRLVNDTGHTVREVYVSPTKTNDWEEDVLDVDVLPDNDSVDISFDDKNKTCIYDMKLVYKDNDTEEWDNINLCEVSKLTVRYEKNGTAVVNFD